MKKIILWALALWLWSGALFAQGLFQLKIQATPEMLAEGEDALLRKAIAIELKRLTGQAQIPEHVARFFLEQPRRWVLRFSFSPYLEDGVQVGQWVHVTFNRQALLKALQERGLRYWPLSERPRMLIAATLIQGEQILPLLDETLRARPDLNFLPVLNELGLPARLPTFEKDILFSAPVITPDMVEAVARQQQVDGILRMTFTERYENRQRIVTLDWEYIDKTGRAQRGRLEGREGRALARQLFQTLAERWRRAARQQAEVASGPGGEAVIRLIRPTVDAVVRLEAAFKAAKERIRQAVMSEVSPEQAVYRVRYAGGWDGLVQWLQALPQAVSVEADAATQTIRITFSEPVAP